MQCLNYAKEIAIRENGYNPMDIIQNGGND